MYDLILRKLRIVRIFRVDVLGIPAFAACSFNSLYEVITRLSWYLTFANKNCSSLAKISKHFRDSFSLSDL